MGNYSIIRQLADKILDVAGTEPINSEEENDVGPQTKLLRKLVDYCHPLPEVKAKPVTPAQHIADSRQGFEEEVLGLDIVRDVVRKAGKADDVAVKRFLLAAATYVEGLIGSINQAKTGGLKKEPSKSPAQERLERAQLENQRGVKDIKDILRRAENLLNNGGIEYNYLHQANIVNSTHPNAHLLTPALIQVIYDSEGLKKLRTRNDDTRISVLPLSQIATKDVVQYFNDRINDGTNYHCVMVANEESEFFRNLQPTLLQMPSSSADATRTLKKIDPAKVQIPNVSRYNSLDRLIEKMMSELHTLAIQEKEDPAFATQLKALEKQYEQLDINKASAARVSNRAIDDIQQKPQRPPAEGELEAVYSTLENTAKQVEDLDLNGTGQALQRILQKGATKAEKLLKERGLNPKGGKEFVPPKVKPEPFTFLG